MSDNTTNTENTSGSTTDTSNTIQLVLLAPGHGTEQTAGDPRNRVIKSTGPYTPQAIDNKKVLAHIQAIANQHPLQTIEVYYYGHKAGPFDQVRDLLSRNLGEIPDNVTIVTQYTGPATNKFTENKLAYTGTKAIKRKRKRQAAPTAADTPQKNMLFSFSRQRGAQKTAQSAATQNMLEVIAPRLIDYVLANKATPEPLHHNALMAHLCLDQETRSILDKYNITAEDFEPFCAKVNEASPQYNTIWDEIIQLFATLLNLPANPREREWLQESLSSHRAAIEEAAATPARPDNSLDDGYRP